ncbi:MAG: restriction endonuclease subunit S [Anaerolineales bacterium]|nr:restriction endonuclease subunit S [Anaerolineales bacterium]
MSKKLTSLSEVIEEISMGPFGSDIKVENFVSSGIPVLNGSNLSGFKLTEDEFKFVTEEKAKTFKKAIARRGDIVITHRGTLGQIAYIPENSKYDSYVISQSQFRVRLKTDKANPAFFVYYFHTAEGQKRLLSFKNHVGVPALAQATTNFRKLEIPLPDLPTQQKIAAVLSALDAKIELNARINAELESMAKTLYDYWFVQFAPSQPPPPANAGTSPKFDRSTVEFGGGREGVVWNDELKRKIPLGWEVKRLGEVLKTNLGGTPSTKQPEYWENATIPWLNSGDLTEFPVIKSSSFVTKKGVDNSATTILPKGSVVISLVRYIRPSIIAMEACANQSVVGIWETKELKSAFIYPSLVNEIPRLMALRTGAQQPHINKEIVDDILLYIPPKDVLEKYYAISEPIYKKIINLAFESQTLTELRDWLLPMLMNGEVTPTPSVLRTSPPNTTINTWDEK